LTQKPKKTQKNQKNQKITQKKTQKIRMNESHFLLQMSNFQKKIFFGRKFQPEKILRKKIEIF